MNWRTKAFMLDLMDELFKMALLAVTITLLVGAMLL